MAFIEPVTLTGRHVQLEPLAPGHHDALVAAASDGELWKLWYTSVPSPQTMRNWLETALSMRAHDDLAFAIRDMRDGSIVGSTRYFRVDAASRRLEIGHTWYARRAQRTGINTEAKLLLLGHAFDALQCIAVEFRTHWMNHQSREAIARLGARQDGVLRNHLRMPDGTLRDTVVFSIIDSEWPTVKRHLQFKLER
ncbi:GNAT family N-acetyltransferase [Noviherbaspirillum suwonense]|uniref:Protein N-acetyltransferase, RimJ/RimL family n=1 Tax=Noviherbaspirillum suwonense TaxID=1224511 RepID=A0ABY1QT24_9BURK|nr:GNAT family protein [Noviherbaspirillum suwonense]SMP78276.1 Protein N-acetyltransferase, RimJ/RimL family [Noviherbaspirillum suwonense]